MITKTRADIMGMPITVAIVDPSATEADPDFVFDYFQKIDNRFSTYKKDSEISQFNRHEIVEKDLSPEVREVFRLSEQTKNETQGFFNIQKADGTIDPSGLVKGWAIWQAAKLLRKKGFTNFYIDAGGDIEASGINQEEKPWRVGIRNPFNRDEIVKVLSLSNKGIATSGTYIRGQHVYNPHQPKEQMHTIVSLSVIALNAYEADRFATAAFAMQEKGIQFIESLSGLEGYMINKEGIATMTSGFQQYVVS